MVSNERGPAEPHSMYSKSRKRRDRDRRCAILQAEAMSHVLKQLLWHRPRDDVAGATGHTGSKLSETVLLNNDNGTGSIWRVDNGMGSRWSPVGVTTYIESKGNASIRKTGNFDWMDCVDSISCLDENLVDVTTPIGKNDFQPPSLTSTFPSRCMSETTNWNVDRETGSLESTGSAVVLISGLNNGTGDFQCAAPKCLELVEETANPEVHTSVSEMSNFDSTDSGPEPISCLGLSSIDVTTSSARGDPPNDVLPGYTGSKLRKTTNLKASTLACSEKSSTNVTPEASLEDTQVSERLYQLAGIIGARRPSQAPWGSGPSLWMLSCTMFGLCPKVCWLP